MSKSSHVLRVPSLILAGGNSVVPHLPHMLEPWLQSPVRKDRKEEEEGKKKGGGGEREMKEGKKEGNA